MAEKKNIDLPERLSNAVDGHIETLKTMKETIKKGEYTITTDLIRLRRDLNRTRDLSEHGE